MENQILEEQGARFLQFLKKIEKDGEDFGVKANPVHLLQNAIV